MVAALSPPVERTLLVGGLVEWASYDGRRYPLSTNEYRDGTIDPQGYRHIEEFSLEGMRPMWIFALGDAKLERRVWMEHGANTTYVTYCLIRAPRPVGLEVTPLVTYSDFHTLTSGRDWRPTVEAGSRMVLVRPFHGARPFWLLASAGQFTGAGEWWWNFLHREETARGLDDRSDLYALGAFTVSVPPGGSFTLVLTTASEASRDGVRALERARLREGDLLNRAGSWATHPIVRQLVVAADQFIVDRPSRNGGPGKSVIAGYHWFNDWGRDTMIALPGLTLATGRPEDAAAILRAFVPYVADGLLPNTFPDRAGAMPGYNTADASLWYVLAVRAYDQATRNPLLVGDLLPVVRDIIDRHIQGTRYGIRMDDTDGLLRAGQPGLALTWMDARIGDRAVTPRIGKPVEINALWYNVLRTVAALLAVRGEAAAKNYEALADRVRASFRARFIQPGQSHLLDVVDGPDGDDPSLRPNQIFAVSLPYPLLEAAEAAAVVDIVGRELLTTYGLRSLNRDAPAYHGDYGGDQAARDQAYHQGTAWSWLIGPYAEAFYRVTGNAAASIELLRVFEHQLQDAGLGTVSEIFDGDPPHQARGCIAQAWSVAEILRVWKLLSSSPAAG